MSDWKFWTDVSAVTGWLLNLWTGFLNAMPAIISFLTTLLTLGYIAFRFWEMKTTQEIYKWVKRKWEKYA